MLKFTIFIALFGASLAFGGPFGNSRRGGHSSEEREDFPHLPFPTFLRNVNETERRAWFEIEHNKNSTKSEVQTLRDQWAANQDSKVQVSLT